MCIYMHIYIYLAHTQNYIYLYKYKFRNEKEKIITVDGMKYVCDMKHNNFISILKKSTERNQLEKEPD